MKASKQCPKCDSLQVGHVESVLDRGDAGVFAPATVGLTEPRGNWLLKTSDVVGELEAYVCAECGYYETYVKDPGSVPFEKLKGFRWLNEPPPPEGPYR